MASHPSILAWKIPWAEEPSELQSMGLQRVGDKCECLLVGLLWISMFNILYSRYNSCNTS